MSLRIIPTDGVSEHSFESRSGDQALDLTTLEALQIAAGECLVCEWVTAEGYADASAEIGKHLRLICTAIHDASQGQPIGVGTLPANVPAHRLLSELRTRFLGVIERRPSPPESSELLRVLAAFEKIQKAFDLDASQRLATRLSGTDALELMVAVAHDMRSPLTSILFLVDTLRNGYSGPLTAQQERQLILVYSAAFGLSSLVSDLMDLARGGGERLLEGAGIPFSVRECMYSVRDIIRPIAEEKRLDIELVTPKIDLRVGYPGALSRVLLNLATNALKFTERGRVQIVAKEVGRKRIEFSVRDTGKGIPQELIGTLFDQFRRRPRSRQSTFSSAGLGLSMCQKLIVAMGSQLQVESELNVGTRLWFEIELPPGRAL